MPAPSSQQANAKLRSSESLTTSRSSMRAAALIAHARMDGAWLGSIDISIHKAFTARAFDMATQELGKMAQSGKPLFGINSTNHDKVVIFAGGMPVHRAARSLARVGASGGTVEQDQKVVEAAVAMFSSER